MKTKTMVTVAGMAMTALMAMADVSFEVKNVQAHQRYPWNGKVDIDFQLTSANPDTAYQVDISCRDNVGKTNIALRTISKDVGGANTTTYILRQGTYRMVWDADKDCPNVKLANISFSVSAKNISDDSTTYLVIDLSGGPNATSYPVSYLTGVPTGGWTDEYKTTKLVMRKCPKGADPLGRYTLTQDFFAGIFEVTQKQYELVMGENPSVLSAGNGSTYPVQYVSWSTCCGGFLNVLRVRAGLPNLNLPTRAQWEYACRAGATSTYNLGDSVDVLSQSGWYKTNSLGKTHPVGQKTPNMWGLYDMHGNVYEWCLDYGEKLSGTNPCDDTAHYSSGYVCFACLGGAYAMAADYCTASYWRTFSCATLSECFGFRIVMVWP